MYRKNPQYALFFNPKPIHPPRLIDLASGEKLLEDYFTAGVRFSAGRNEQGENERGESWATTI